MKARITALIWAVPVVVASCFIPIGGFGDDQFAMPTVLATYTRGSASLEITQGKTTQTITLTRVAPGSALMSMVGGAVTWRNDDGWGLELTTYDSSLTWGPRPSPSGNATPVPTTTSAPYLGDLTLLLIADHEYWRASSTGESGNRCIVDLTEASSSRVAGTATCRGLRWMDGTSAQLLLEPVYIDGQDPFDAEVTFEATP